MNKVNLQPQLSGKNFNLRPLKESDFESLFTVASDPLIWEVHPEPMRYKKEVFRKYFDDGLASGGALLIEDAKTKEVAGSSRFYGYDVQKKEMTIGYTFLARKYWGGEYNRELKHLMLQHAFQFIDTAIFEVGSENIRSQKAMLKIGGQIIGKKEKLTSDGRPLTNLIFTIKKTDFTGLI